MKEETFTTFDISKGLKIKRSSLQQWIDRGFVKPSICRATGQGTKNLFSRADLFRIYFFTLLSEFGWPQEEAGKQCRIRSFGGGEVKNYYMRRKDVDIVFHIQEIIDKINRLFPGPKPPLIVSEATTKLFTKWWTEEERVL